MGTEEGFSDSLPINFNGVILRLNLAPGSQWCSGRTGCDARDWGLVQEEVIQ